MVSRFAVLFILVPLAAFSQVPEPGQDTARLVMERSRELFRVLPESNGSAIRSFFADSLLNITTEEGVGESNSRISERAGGILGYYTHNLTFYPREESLLAALDFSGAGANGSLVCGYLVWSLPSPDEVGLVRIDQVVAERAIFVDMPYDVAEEAMEKFPCPADAETDFLASLPSAPK